jgi:N-acetylmuramoyl-L-alanine amidase
MQIDTANPTQYDDFYGLFLLALCLWREDRGGSLESKTAVAWSIKNRVENPGWWGYSWISCILMPWQYSSFNRNDPNSSKFPVSDDPSWRDSMNVATSVFDDVIADPTGSATHYFDNSLDGDPPKWATDGSMVKTVDIGRLHFYRRVV